MKRILTGVAAAVLALSASGAMACDYHESHVTASTEQDQTGVAMSTHDGSAPPLVGVDETPTVEAADPACAEGGAGCTADKE